MIYVTEDNTCPLGCGELVFLKSIESGKIFLHCCSCGLAWPKPPATPDVVDCWRHPTQFAPTGIDFPRREEIEAAGFGSFIASEQPNDDNKYFNDKHFISSLWELRAITFFAAGDDAKGIEVVTEVIDTWYSPPSEAYELRAEAYRRIGSVREAEQDERTAERLKLQYATAWKNAAKQKDT